MSELSAEQRYGTGKKKLSVYVIGIILCVILTLISFFSVMYLTISRDTLLMTIFASAIIQFIVQVVCFLRLNAKTEQGQMNLMSFIFTLGVLLVLVAGSLWIMWSLHHYMMH